MTNWESIIAFHEKFGIDMPKSSQHLTQDVHNYRVNFLKEELHEYITAVDLEDKIDALIDLVVVAMGTAYMHGFNWEAHWEEVFRANMAKRKAQHASESKRGHSLDIVKPEGWKGPNHTQHIRVK